MNHKEEIKILSNYIEKYYKKPNIINKSFYQRSYAHWAANEILSEIRMKEGDVIDILNHFRRKMEDYSCKKGYEPQNLIMFSIAADVADNLLCLFL